LAVVAVFAHKAASVVTYAMGIVLPLVFYRWLNPANRWAHVLVVAGALISGGLGGLFQGLLCGWVRPRASFVGVEQAALLCTEHDIGATYWTGFCLPLLPAAMIALIVWYNNRSLSVGG
jgi:hypothetical protein